MKVTSVKEKISFFDTMDVGDSIDVLNEGSSRVVFRKRDYDTGEFEAYVGGTKIDENSVSMDYSRFGVTKQDFINDIKYLIVGRVNHPSYKPLLEKDLAKTKLKLIKPGHKVNLGYGVFAERIDSSELPADLLEGLREREREGGGLFFENYIFKFGMLDKNDKMVTLTIYNVPYEDIHKLRSIRGFQGLRRYLINVLEETIDTPIDYASDMLQAQYDLKEVPREDELAVSYDPENLTGQDLHDYLEKKEKELGEDNPEIEEVRQRVNKLVKRLKSGFAVTERDLTRKIKPTVLRPETHKINLRDRALLAQINRKLSMAVFEIQEEVKRLRSEDKPEEAMQLQAKMIEAKKEVIKLKIMIQKEKNRAKQDELVQEVNLIIKNMPNFIKK